MFGNRPARGPSGDPATRILIAANVAIFVLQLLAGRHWLPVLEMFALSPSGLREGALWQLVTYQFLHANELHILMNMLGLWFVGRELERVVGTRRFVALYLGGGVVAGLAQMLFASGGGPLIGASGSVFAVLLAFTTLFPSLPVTALVFFVLPVRMRARTLGLVAVAASVIFWISGAEPGIGHLAHLGGCLAGWIFGRVYRTRFGEGGASFGGGFWRTPPWGRGPAPRDVSYLRPLPSVDEVLAKVFREGINSLSREERRILEESRRPRGRG
jgi:membrane associated rhomboid family serine protease